MAESENTAVLKGRSMLAYVRVFSRGKTPPRAVTPRSMGDVRTKHKNYKVIFA